MEGLVVIAHPDDEVIWTGGLILRHAEWNWHVLSLCRADDPDRAPRFLRAADALGAHPVITSLDDSPDLAPLSLDLSEITLRIRQLVPSRFDVILTHGLRGEYTRHPRHEQVHRAVRMMVDSGELRGELFCFAYQDCGGDCVPTPEPDADIRIELTPEEFRMKRYIIKEIYGFQEGSFEYNAAGPIEAFHAVSLYRGTLSPIPASQILLGFGDGVPETTNNADHGG